MSAIERALARLSALKIESAIQGLARPNEKTEFEFGRLSGMTQAFEQVEEILTSIAGEDDEESSEDRPSSFGVPLIKS